MSLCGRLTCLLLVLTLSTLSSSELISTTHKRTSYVGWNATIPCRTEVSKDVDWKYQASEADSEDYIYSNGVMYDRFRARMMVVKSADGDYDLIIKNVMAADAGQYICIEDLGFGARHVNELVVSAAFLPLPTSTTSSPAADDTPKIIPITVSVLVIILLIVVILGLLYRYRRRACSKFYHDHEDTDKPHPQEIQPLKAKLVGPEITTADSGSDRVTLSWNFITDQEPVAFIVKYRKDSDAEGLWKEISGIIDRTVTVSDLSPSTAYLFQVVACTADKTHSPPSAEMKCCTTAALPRQPTRVLVAQTTSTSIKLAWFTDSGEAVSFTVHYRPSRHTADTDHWLVISGIATTEHTVTDLQPYTEYQLRVVAVGKAGCSEPSDTVEGRTLREMKPVDKRLRGYSFNDHGQLRDADGKPFVFKIHDSHEKNQQRYESIGEAITDEVYRLLETQCGLQKVLLPCGVQEDSPHSFIFTSRQWIKSTDRLLILIHGSGVVRAGQWARKLIMNDDMDKGTQIPYIERAMSEGYEVAVFNTNLNKFPDVSRADGVEVHSIPENESPESHALYVWKEFISSQVNAKHIAIVAHSYGGIIVMKLMEANPEEFKKRVFAVAFTESVHSSSIIPESAGTFFHERARNWVTVTNLEPPGFPLPHRDTSERDAPKVSCGHTTHEWSSHSSFDSVFKFLSERYAERLTEQ